MLSGKEQALVGKWIVDGTGWDNKEVKRFLDSMDDKAGTDKSLIEMMRAGVAFNEALAIELEVHHDDP